MSYIKNSRCHYVYVNRGRHLYECLITCLRKSTSKIGLELLVFFTSINFFYENIHLLPPDCAFGPFTYVCCENCMSGFSTFVLNLSKSGNIFFSSMPNGNYLLSSASLSLVGDSSLVHELRVMAAVELSVNATYAQHPALKSVYEKSQSVMVASYFPPIGQCLN